MAPGGRGGRGGARGGRGGYGGGTGKLTIGGTEVNWDLTGLEIKRTPAERFPEAPPPQAPPATTEEDAVVHHYIAIRDRIHDGPFYTVLNDGMKHGLKRKANQPAPTEESLFNPFSDNQTYSARYLKVRRRIPKLDSRPYVVDFFPPELRGYLERTSPDAPNKKRKLLSVSKVTAASQIDRMIKQEQNRNDEAAARAEEEEDEDEEEEEEDDTKPDAVEEEDNWSAVSSDSEDEDDDYNAEQYFDNGEDDDIDDVDPYENTYE